MDTIIDVELLHNHLPEGDYIVRVNLDNFDEDILKHFIPEANSSEWTEILLTVNNPESAYIIQGQIIFVHQSGDIYITNDIIVKQCVNISFICKLGKQHDTKFFNSTVKYLN